MHIDRFAIRMLLAGGTAVGCGGGHAQEAPPKGADTAATPSAPVAAAPSTAARETTTSEASDPKAICEKLKTKPAAGPLPRTGDGTTFGDLTPPAKPPANATLSARNAKDAAGRGYTLADLKALAEKGQWEELVQHIEDVPPAKRGAEWDALLERAATEFLASYGSQNTSYGAFHSAERLVERYPALVKSQRFMAKRFEVSKAAFQSCLTETYDGDECLRAMRDFLAVGAPPPEVAFQFGKLVRGKLNHYLAVPFFRRGLEGKAPNSHECADQDLGLAVKAGLALPPDDENARFSREIAGERCFGTLEKALLTQLSERGSESYEAQNICSVLKAKGAL